MIATNLQPVTIQHRELDGAELAELWYSPGSRVSINSPWPSLIVLIAGSWHTEFVGLASQNRACSLITVPSKAFVTGHSGATGLRMLEIRLKHPYPAAGNQERISIHRGGEPTRKGMQIFWTLQRGPLSTCTELSQLLQELSISLASESRKLTYRQPPSWLHLVVDRLHGEFRRPPAVRDLAATASVDPCHLARTFRRYLLCTIGQYVRQLRLEDALRRMLGCDHRLVEIAAATGFADQAHFTRTFKQELGITPRDYRRRLRENQPGTDLQSNSLNPSVAVSSR